MKIIVTRHGQTTHNIDNRISGISDVELTESGIQQARDTGKKIKDYDLIISSPLKRARDTAKYINENHHKEIIIDERLHEINFGLFEGKRNNEDFQKIKFNHATHYPEGESLFKVVQRVYNCLDDLIEKYHDKTVLIVCHGGILRIIHSYFENMSNEELFTWLPENCCVLEYHICENNVK